MTRTSFIFPILLISYVRALLPLTGLLKARDRSCFNLSNPRPVWGRLACWPFSTSFLPSMDAPAFSKESPVWVVPSPKYMVIWTATLPNCRSYCANIVCNFELALVLLSRSSKVDARHIRNVNFIGSLKPYTEDRNTTGTLSSIILADADVR